MQVIAQTTTNTTNVVMRGTNKNHWFMQHSRKSNIRFVFLTQDWHKVSVSITQHHSRIRLRLCIQH